MSLGTSWYSARHAPNIPDVQFIKVEVIFLVVTVKVCCFMVCLGPFQKPARHTLPGVDKRVWNKLPISYFQVSSARDFSFGGWGFVESHSHRSSRNQCGTNVSGTNCLSHTSKTVLLKDFNYFAAFEKGAK